MWTVHAASLVQATCLLAIVLNVAHYYVIRLLGAGTYQVLSQLKTIAVIVLGSQYIQGVVDPRQVAGAAATLCAVTGLTHYELHLTASHTSSGPGAACKASEDNMEEGRACQNESR